MYSFCQARNVLIDSTLRAKVADFGFAYSVCSETTRELTQLPVSKIF